MSDKFNHIAVTIQQDPNEVVDVIKRYEKSLIGKPEDYAVGFMGEEGYELCAIDLSYLADKDLKVFWFKKNISRP